MDKFADQLSSLLSKRKSTIRAEWDARPAAVLIPIYTEDGEWHVVYTRRTERVEHHRGQVSFPGGLVEDLDGSAKEAALREAEEEIALSKESVKILGSLDTLFTVTQFQILPFVGQIPWPYTFHPNPDEVAHVFSVPLRWLMDPVNLELRHRRPIPNGPKVPVYYFKPFQGEIIWGATARITLNLLEIIKPLLFEEI
jgi:8-oxo-dGTP pyrophosphatase MutT (NUDIX family)